MHRSVASMRVRDLRTGWGYRITWRSQLFISGFNRYVTNCLTSNFPSIQSNDSTGVGQAQRLRRDSSRTGSHFTGFSLGPLVCTSRGLATGTARSAIHLSSAHWSGPQFPFTSWILFGQPEKIVPRALSFTHLPMWTRTGYWFIVALLHRFHWFKWKNRCDQWMSEPFLIHEWNTFRWNFQKFNDSYTY